MAMGKKKLLTTAFYNIIADQYNSQLTESDEKIRAFVSIEFKKLVKGINILDFGGGTGLDLNWLLQSYTVFFLEPAINMRTIARNNLEADGNVFFATENIDFNTWDEGNLPFSEKVDGVLMNFAVLNCIRNIDVLFNRLAMLCNEQAHLFALVINDDNIRTNPVKKLLYSMINKPVTIYNNGKGIGHKTYLHTREQLRSAFKKRFNYISCNPIEFSNFTLLILTKK